MKYALAIDIGASSGRHILGWMENGLLKMEEIYRFPNGYVPRNGHDVWDVDALFGHIVSGLKKCSESGRIPETVGIDTWGVDYVLLDREGNRIGDAVAYRDSRTEGMDRKLEQTMSFRRLYELTGIAKQPFNTVYQLMADEKVSRAESLLFMPSYLSYLLSGKGVNEYTDASTGALLNAATRDWDPEVLSAAGIAPEIFGGKPVMPGTVLGDLLPAVREQVGFNCKVMLAPGHDTASAFYSLPFDPETVIISSGTWSLLGTILEQPCTGEDAMNSGFTNEGGVAGIRFLQNIMGLWMLQCIRHEWNDRLSFAEMADLAATATHYTPVVNATDNRFLSPDSMITAIREALTEQGDPLPASDAELLYCVNHSLAVCYAGAIQRLEAVTDKSFTSVTIVGGGNQNRLLNRLTEEATGLPVRLGYSEATAAGNLLCQLENS